MVVLGGGAVSIERGTPVNVLWCHAFMRKTLRLNFPLMPWHQLVEIFLLALNFFFFLTTLQLRVE